MLSALKEVIQHENALDNMLFALYNTFLAMDNTFLRWINQNFKSKNELTK